MSYFMQKMLERQDGVDDLCLIVSNNEQAVVRTEGFVVSE